MMFSIAYRLLQRLFVRDARSGLFLILASIVGTRHCVHLAPTSWCSIVIFLHI